MSIPTVNHSDTAQGSFNLHLSLMLQDIRILDPKKPRSLTMDSFVWIGDAIKHYESSIDNAAISAVVSCFAPYQIQIEDRMVVNCRAAIGQTFLNKSPIFHLALNNISTYVLSKLHRHPNEVLSSLKLNLILQISIFTC
jgi:hypothetical protein